MLLNVWSSILMASCIQCLFLIIFLARRKCQNKLAKSLLLSLLLLVLAINLSNLILVNQWYRTIPQIAGFGRGMGLLFGPLLYSYICSMLNPTFKLKRQQLWHVLPYAIALVFIRFQMHTYTSVEYIKFTDYMLEHSFPMTFQTTLWFMAYFTQLSFYLYLIQKQISKAKTFDTKWRINQSQRIKWARQFSFIFFMLAVYFLTLTIYCLTTSSYVLIGNFTYAVILAVCVYCIAYQALIDNDVLTADFNQKYAKTSLQDHVRDSIKIGFQKLMEEDKFYKDSEIKLHKVAKLLNTTSTVLSAFINTEYGRSFSDCIHHYRIEEFKRLAHKSLHKEYSIIGMAYEVGYNSKSTFNTAFKRIVGKTPSAYIKDIVND